MKPLLTISLLAASLFAGCATRSLDEEPYYLDITTSATHRIYTFSYPGSHRVIAHYYRLDTGLLERTERLDR